jgi:hypothetical protein
MEVFPAENEFVMTADAALTVPKTVSLLLMCSFPSTRAILSFNGQHRDNATQLNDQIQFA